VELDLHAGLMDTLEVEWRGQVMVQRLDYQGLPFQCSNCRRMGHLRKDCPHGLGVSVPEVSLDTDTNDLYMPEEHPEELGDGEDGSCDFSPVLLSDSFLGKLKAFCPALFFKLSLWERDFLVKSFPPSLSTICNRGM
jgi:hypothetical protein